MKRLISCALGCLTLLSALPAAATIGSETTPSVGAWSCPLTPDQPKNTDPNNPLHVVPLKPKAEHCHVVLPIFPTPLNIDNTVADLGGKIYQVEFPAEDKADPNFPVELEKNFLGLGPGGIAYTAPTCAFSASTGTASVGGEDYTIALIGVGAYAVKALVRTSGGEIEMYIGVSIADPKASSDPAQNAALLAAACTPTGAPISNLLVNLYGGGVYLEAIGAAD